MMHRRFPTIALLLFFLLAPRLALCAILPHDKIKNGGYILYHNGRIIDQYRASELFVPASTIKLLTAYTALKTLGPQYRFVTSFYLDANQVLYIRGGGDPVLTTESLIAAVRELRSRGVVEVAGYVLDDSGFALEQPLPDGSENSANPYDAANGGLAVNFNSVAILKHADGRVVSGEAQTPLTQLGREIGALLKPGRHRVNIDAFPQRSALPAPLRYTAELLHELLLREGVASQAVIRQGRVPVTARPIYQHKSALPLDEIVRSCLKVSNNFVANQLALTAGAVRFGYPASWEKARNLLQQTAWQRIGISSRELRIVEGSGLSRQTRATPIAMLKLLQAFEPYRDLLPQKHGVLMKSGTMKDIYCYAGYMQGKEQSLLFVLLLNQAENNRRALLANLSEHFMAPGAAAQNPKVSSR